VVTTTVEARKSELTIYKELGLESVLGRKMIGLAKIRKVHGKACPWH
jgi:hypothetical protein